MSNKNLHIDLLRKHEYRMIWNMNLQCNFACSYCYFTNELNTKSEKINTFSPEEIQNCFDKTNKTWLVLLSGGEPFLYPNFIEITERLTIKHNIQVSTNLFSEKIYEFAEKINPEKVMTISASLHIQEREKHQNGLGDFIKKCLHLQSKGFRVLVNYVSWPPLFNRMEEDFKMLADAGIQQATVLTYRGMYNNKFYPESYTEEQQELIQKHALDQAEMLISRCKTNFKGFICDAGHNYFSMNPNGEITRCGTIHKSYGNLFNDTFIPDNVDKPCINHECIDCYLGIISKKDIRAGNIAILKEKFSYWKKKKKE